MELFSPGLADDEAELLRQAANGDAAEWADREASDHRRMEAAGLRAQRSDRWPEEGDTIPVTVDRANPQNFEIPWSEVPKVEDRLRQRVDQKTQAALDEERGRSRKPPKDPSQSWVGGEGRRCGPPRGLAVLDA